MKANGTHVARLRKFREARRHVLLDLPGVLGSGLGLKNQAGVATDEPAVVVLVRKKKPDASLAESSRVPPRLRYAGRSVATDVIEVRALSQQADRFCFDGAHLGVVSAFAHDGETVFGVTCAHCMQGAAGAEQEPVPISIARDDHQGYDEVGRSSYRIIGAGTGVPGDFGFADAGLFTLAPEHARRLIPRRRALPIADVALEMPVRGMTGHGLLTGSVSLVEVEYGSVLVDALVRVNGQGTYPGDSGMMWFSDQDEAVGVHALGSDRVGAGGSGYSAVMFPGRVEYYLGVQLLRP